MLIRNFATPLIAAALGVGPVAVASAQEAAPKVKEEQRIVILEQADGKAPPSGAREFRIRRGADGRLALPEGCSDGRKAAEVDEKVGDKRTFVLICTKEGENAADQIASLEKAKARLTSDSHLSAETRNKVLAQLETQIARLKAGQ